MEESKGAYRVLVGKPERIDNLDDLGVDGRVILKWILITWDGNMNWIELAQDRERWRALVNTVMSLGVP
jgi:hypothetical protein